MLPPPKEQTNHKLAIFLICIILIAALATALSAEVYLIITQNNQKATFGNATASPDEAQTNTTLSQIYQQASPSIVVIQDIQTETEDEGFGYTTQEQVQVQGSGFIYNLTGTMIVITNNHVIDEYSAAQNIEVTFQDGNTYTSTVLGSDPYSDLAVLSTANINQSELVPIQITTSSTLQVGDDVIAIGSPYGLSGSMTTGIVSALNRTIIEDTAGDYEIADIIQTSTPINPGNSGGPLLNSAGQVIGITTAIVSDSQGLGFAIPSDTILREVSDLANGEPYYHPYLGIEGTDMTYDIAQQTDASVTYGVLIEGVNSTGPAANKLEAGTTESTIDGSTVYTGGDIITAINGTRIRSMDDLSSYLEEYTKPNDVINITFVTDNKSSTQSVVQVTLGERPLASS